MTSPGPTDAEMAELVRRGRTELDAVDELRLARIWRGVEVAICDEEPEVAAPAPPSAPPSGGAARLVGWRRHVPMAAAAAFALVVGAGVGLAWPEPSDEPARATLATYELEPLEGVDATVSAAVLREEDGVRVVEVDLTDLPPTSGHHEVWLLDTETGSLASLGPVRPDGRYVVPSGTDLATLTTLDVSDEPADGDPGHSGVSLLRGALTWTG